MIDPLTGMPVFGSKPKVIRMGGGGAGGTVNSIVAGSGISVNSSDIANPIISVAEKPDYFPNLRLPKFAVPSTTVTQFQSGHGWLGSSGFNANDTSDFVLGSQAVSIPTNGAGATFKIEKTGLSIDTTGQQIRLRIKYENLGHVFTTQFIIGNDTSYTNCYTWSIAAAVLGYEFVTEGDWVTITLNFASATTTGAPTRTGIVAMKLTVRDDSAGVVTAHMNSVELVAEPTTNFPNGLVSICFDDSFGSFWSLAKPKLDANNLRASHFVIQDLIGLASKMTATQYQVLQSQGHEIGAHMYTNADHTSTYTGLTSSLLDSDLRSQVATLRNLGLRGQGTAYPLGQFGKTTDNVSTSVYAGRYFSYARTTARRQMETWPPPEPLRLRAQSGISTFSGGYAPSNISTATTGDIDKAKTNHAWLILVFHSVVTTTPTGTTEILQSDFNTIIDKIVSSGVACVPIGEALAYYN